MTTFWRQYRRLALTIVLLLLIAAGAFWLRGGSLDQQVFRWINGSYHSPFLDGLALAFTALGSFWGMLALLAVLFLIGYRRFAVYAAAATLVLVGLVEAIKYLTHRPRPWQVLAGARLVGSPIYGLGFPSGHAAQSFLIAYLLDRYFLPPWYGRAGLYLLAALIALSRVYLGVHYPADIVAGAALGLLVGICAVHARPWPGARRKG